MCVRVCVHIHDYVCARVCVIFCFPVHYTKIELRTEVI